MNERILREIIERALDEDIGHGDITTESTVDPMIEGMAVVVAKQAFLLAGLDAFLEVFFQLDPSVEFTVSKIDGDRVKKGEAFAELKGGLRTLLTGERVALNILQRMSGIATLTAKYTDAVKGTNARLLDTRKTTPGLRMLEKYAVRVGGGHNHRYGLYDGLLIKDNHITAAGGITEAIRGARKRAPHTLRIEVECETVEQVAEAIKAGADIVMLDNMSAPDMKKSVKTAGGRVLVEASGNMTPKRAAEAAGCGVDFVSVGALTHSAPAVDISMLITG